MLESEAVSRGQVPGGHQGVWDALCKKPHTSLEITTRANPLRRTSCRLQEERASQQLSLTDG